jgi:hypothetical protein
MAEKSPKFKVIDTPSINEVYANKVVATSFDGGAVTVTLGATRFLPEHAETPKEKQAANVHVTARVALSPAAAVELTNALGAMLKNMSELRQKAAEKSNEEPAS